MIGTMKKTIALACLLALAPGTMPFAQPPSPAHSAPKKEIPVIRATGAFDVKLNPLEAYNKTENAGLGRMSIDKVFKGDLEATSQGEMLNAIGSVKGSAGYVAMERVTGKLNGRSGSFVLQHTGTMNRGARQLSVTVVPDSGTGQLAGLSGRMDIIITDGKHSYEFDYTLAEAAP